MHISRNPTAASFLRLEAQPERLLAPVGAFLLLPVIAAALHFLSLAFMAWASLLAASRIALASRTAPKIGLTSGVSCPSNCFACSSGMTEILLAIICG